MQVPKRKVEQRKGDVETSPRDRIRKVEGISQSEGNKEEEETNDAEAEDQKEGGDETSNEKKTSVTGEEEATAAEESNYRSGEAERRRGFPMLYIE